LLQKSETGKGS